jgi:murein DD-endopeptidase MepM/ murein hydrolase activator NlpD
MPVVTPESKDGSQDTPQPQRPHRILSVFVNILLVASLVALGIVAWLRLPRWVAWAESRSNETTDSPQVSQNLTDTLDSPSAPLQSDGEPVLLQPIPDSGSGWTLGVSRKLQMDTEIPNRPRVDVITYTVESGDNLFSIADQYGLKAETILWGNFETLQDNPNMLSTGQVLNILPTDGTYYEWNSGDNLANVAAFFKVAPEAILNFSGNNIDLTTTDMANPGIEPGTWVIIPGGKRPLKDWGPPAISRSNPASARYYGDGYCGEVYEGAIGTGTFVWPTSSHSISGYGYSGIHPAIDIGGAVGNAVVAADSGVVVFSGWSNYGYGYMVVIDHGTGWQTAYAHLSAVAVGCGQSVFQGGYIGAVGSTGNSSGPHLHFETVYNGAKPNPLDYLP